MRIGEISELTGLSVSNIRFYEKKGLIGPDRDPNSKYRNYTIDDLNRLKEIILFRKMNLSVDVITQIFCKELPLEEAINNQLQSLNIEKEQLQSSIDLCEKALADYNIETSDKYEFSQETINSYLTYVKNEENNGRIFEKVDDILEDLSTYTRANEIFFFSNYTINKIVRYAWNLLILFFPILGIFSICLDKEQISIPSLIFFISWFFIVLSNYILSKVKINKK